MWKRTFFPVGHFYSPVPDPEEARLALEKAVLTSGRVPAGISIDDVAILKLWKDIAPFMCSAPFSEVAGPSERYQYHNGFYSYGDALVLHGFIRLMRPKSLIEVGSGYSTAAVLDTRDIHGVPKQVTCVEPYPKRLKSLLHPSDKDVVAILDIKVQDTGIDLYETLRAGDILFIDSSHVMKTGSDLNHLFHNVLPNLRPGVIIHFHDIFWPFEYPEQWAVKENRGWNEVYAIRNFLMYNDTFEILFFNQYFAHMHRDVAQADCPLFLENPGGGLWLRKNR